MTQRVCFLMQLKKDRVDDYLVAHEIVWPEMLDALSRSGWHNYSLFVRKDDGLIVGYLETEDFAAAQAAMNSPANKAINDRWQAGMTDFFDNGGRAPDAAMEPLTEYFHLA